MKNKLLNSSIKITWILLLAMFAFVACEKDDDDDDDNDDTVLVEDGFYLKGAGTALADLDPKGQMKVTRNEVLQEDRSDLMEIYVAVQGGADGFSLVEVAGTDQTTYGPGADFALVAEAELDGEEPQEGLWKGSYEASSTVFTVPEDGLYHVVVDKEIQKVAVARVKWGLIGAATPGGWGSNTEMTATFDLNTMDFIVEDVTMLENEWKLRYSNGWKIILDADYDLGGGNTGIKVNTNFGGAVDALVPGGGNIANTEYAVYKFTFTWTLGEDYELTQEKTGDAEPLPEYPEAVYLVGDATAYGWDTPGGNDDALFHKCAGGSPSEGIFWKIAHITGGSGFKISEADWGSVNLGYAEVSEFDAEGIAVTDNGGNMSVADDGVYMIVLSLRDDMTKVSVKAAEVYGIGDCFGAGDWTEDDASALFTVDVAAKTVTSPALAADGNIRMYAQHAWIPDWWNAEFNVFDGAIVYRNDGGDQDPVAGTTGQVVTLMFDDNTGTIE